MEHAEWTIDELAARVAAVLDDEAYPGAPNGRVRDVPDARTIRWYATIGLVDRPTAMRGRTALYGHRHLLQLVAIKRRQAQGRRVAEIQAELVGAPSDVLSSIANLPEPGPDPGIEPPPAPARARFWAQPTAIQPPSHDTVAGQTLAARPARSRAPRGVPLNGLHLEGGAVLLLPTAPDPDTVPAILAAARPLLELLAARGLLADPPA